MSRLITPESPLLVPPILAAEIGLSEALILQQIHYFCQISNHIKDDGRIWFWKTLDDWHSCLPCLSISKIRRAIANLRDKFKLIDVCRHSKKTWYQANWFTVNVENVEALWNRICHLQQINLSDLDRSICSLPANHIKDFPSEDFSSSKHGVEEQKEDVDWETLAKQNQIQKQSQIAKCTDEVEAQIRESTAQYQEQSQIKDTTTATLSEKTKHPHTLKTQQVESTNGEESHEGQLSKAETVISSDSPTKLEIKEICTELKRLRINPEPCLGVVKKYWENVQDAIARVKEAINEGWCSNPTGLFINSCKSGAKAKNTVTSDVTAWFDWARRERLVLAMSGGVVYTHDGEAVKIEEMMHRYPMKE